MKNVCVDIGGYSPKCPIPQDEIFLTLDISNKFLRKNQCNINENRTFVDIINTALDHVQLRSSQRLETRLLNESSRSVAVYKSTKGGNNKIKCDKKVKKIAVLQNELQIVSDVIKNTHLRIDYSETNKEDSGANKSLQNNGTRLDNVSDHNKKRVLKKLETNTKTALEFVETYGVLPKSLVCETFDGKRCVVNVDGSKSKNSYDTLPTKEKNQVKQLVHICDNSMISDASYHELAMSSNGSLPPKHLLIACRNEANDNYETKRIPGMLPGSYLSFEKEIIRDINMAQNSGETIPNKIQIKLSGDGAKVSRVSNFVIVSYAILNINQSSSHQSQRVLAIVECEENRTNLEKTLGPLFDEINKIHSAGRITVAETEYETEIFVGGDMKFLQLLLGLNGSTANYACCWCKVAKDDRGTITHDWNYYHKDTLFRTVAEMKKLSESTKVQYGVKHTPLLNIELDHYIPDELHLLLRVMDVLLRNLIDDALSKDISAKIRGGATDNFEILVKAIKSCGVSFKHWRNKVGEIEWTSLCGNDMKRVLRELPDKLVFCLHEETTENVVKLWKDFGSIYHTISTQNASPFVGIQVFDNIKRWMQDFLQLGELKLEGYLPRNITPYLHTLLYHVPYFLQEHGSLIRFTGQGVEKTNDIVKQIHHTKSSKQDSTRDALLVRKRLELGYQTNMDRQKRKYVKKDINYWTHTKSLNRKLKSQRIEAEMVDANREFESYTLQNIDFDEMQIPDLKRQLAALGITTKLRKREKLVDLLKNATKSHSSVHIN